jgi:hypothetical protein
MPQILKRTLVSRASTYRSHNHRLTGQIRVRNTPQGSFFAKGTLVSDARARKSARDFGETNVVLELASKIATLQVERVRERYHELIDKKPYLSLIERFELERIKSRLNAEDFDPEQEARDRAWEQRRTEVLDSIENLLDRLRQADL